MFKKTAVGHLIFMLILELALCYGVVYGLAYIIQRPDNSVKQYSYESNYGQYHEVIQRLGSDYLRKFEAVHGGYGAVSSNLRYITVSYNYTEREFNNIVWLLTWLIYAASMFSFFFITLISHDCCSTAIIAPPLCKLLDLLLEAAPGWFSIPIKSGKQRKQEHINKLSEQFINYRR